MWNILQGRSYEYVRLLTKAEKFKKTEIISAIFSDHSGIELEITRRILEKSQIYGNQTTCS